MHAHLKEGVTLLLGAPRNLFALKPVGTDAILLAGGIGITPLLAMSYALYNDNSSFKLKIFSKSEAEIPFHSYLPALPFAQHVSTHIDECGQPAFNAKRDVGPYHEGRQLYMCGPPGFMDAVRRDAHELGWPEAAIHSESFGNQTFSTAQNVPFELELQRSKKRFTVSASTTILDALRHPDIDVPTACLQGVCGRCITPVIEGKVDHRDAILTDEQRQGALCVCVSRAHGTRLVIGL